MNYWLDLFTGKTWDEFRTAGANITGFRASMRSSLHKVMPGHIFVCYLTGVMRWVGALEVIAPSKDQRRIWESDDFPVRFAVKPLIMLDPECGVPMDRFEGKLDFYGGPEHRGGFKGFLRRSPNLFRREKDGALIVEALRDAERNPVPTPVDPRKLARKARYFKSNIARVRRRCPRLSVCRSRMKMSLSPLRLTSRRSRPPGILKSSIIC